MGSEPFCARRDFSVHPACRNRNGGPIPGHKRPRMTAVRAPLPGYLAAAVNKLDRVFAGALPEPEKRLHW